MLDDGSVYQERLEVMLRRLELRSQLYRQPERPEDQAAMIIEQVLMCSAHAHHCPWKGPVVYLGNFLLD